MTRGFEPVEHLAGGGRRGSITFEASAGPPPVLLVVARGPIGPGLVRRDLAVARGFAANQDGPWWYVVDPTGALPHPANLRYLRAVRRLPNVAGYVVVARRWPIRLASLVLAGLGGPHCVVPSLDEALRWIRSESGVPGRT